MKINLTFLLSFFTSLLFCQESELNLGTNLVVLCGAQDVFVKNSPQEEYSKNYTWPDGTYTLFQIKREEKVFTYQTVSASLVQKAVDENSETKEILNSLLSYNENIEFSYEIIEEIEPVKGLSQEYITGMIYILKLEYEKAENVNTSAQLKDGDVSISSVDMDGNPYKSVYPVIYYEVFVSGF